MGDESKRIGLFLLCVCLAWAQTSPPWPAIGPDVDNNGPAKHRYDIPAKRCFDKTPIDTSFNGPKLTITSITWSSSKVVTVAATGVGSLPETALVTIAGVLVGGSTSNAYNGTFAIATKTTSPEQVTYNLATNPGTGTGGTIQYTPTIRLFDARACYVY